MPAALAEGFRGRFERRRTIDLKSTLRLPGLKVWACSGLTLSATEWVEASLTTGGCGTAETVGETIHEAFDDHSQGSMNASRTPSA